MATIVIEDGTFPAAANSYVTEAEALTYHADRGNDSWKAAKATERQGALIRAAFALETLYMGKWVGVKTQSWKDSDGNAATPVQQLAWPRVEVAAETVGSETLLTDVDGIPIARTEIPTQVKHAQMELALIELTQRVVGNIVSPEEAVKFVKVGQIEKEFFPSAPMVNQWPHIDMILSGLVPASGSSGGIDVVIGLTEAEINQDDTPEYTNYPNYFYMV